MMIFKSQKGITLVALIITIIVLLILAGVSISLVVGDNGILTKTKQASSKTNEQSVIEEVELAYTGILSKYYEDYANNASANKDDYITEENLQRELTGIVNNYVKNLRTNVITLEYEPNEKPKKYYITILPDGTVMETPYLQEKTIVKNLKNRTNFNCRRYSLL